MDSLIVHLTAIQYRRQACGTTSSSSDRESFNMDLLMEQYDGAGYSEALAPGGANYDAFEEEVRQLLHNAFGDDLCVSVDDVQSGSIAVSYSATARKETVQTQSNLTSTLRLYLLSQPNCQENDCDLDKLDNIQVPPDPSVTSGTGGKEYLGIGWMYWVIILLAGVVLILFLNAICIICCMSRSKKGKNNGV